MTILVHQAIGKHINPTRYRQIIETESSERLNLDEQHFITEDQKHSSTVAKIHYKKTQSRIVAVEGRKCMEKMTKEARGNQNLIQLFNNVSTFDENVLIQSQRIIGDPSNACCSKNLQQMNDVHSVHDPYQPMNESLNESTDLTITETLPANNTTNGAAASQLRTINVPNDDIVIKRETAQRQVDKKPPKNVKFTSEEDHYLKEGIQKYGRKSWALILKDPSLRFHTTRTRDSLRVRADSACFRRLIGENS